MPKKISVQIVLFALLQVAASMPIAASDASLEESVCGWIAEPMLFSILTNMAGKPNQDRVKSFSNVKAISYKTVDGRSLGGFHIEANGKSRGALLVAQGNAMLAEHLVKSFSFIADRGIDVFIFDYRGYGLSEGVPRLKAIISDYRELMDEVSRLAPTKLYLYGMSFGGVVLLKANASSSTNTTQKASAAAVVIDSSPSKISDMGCPSEYDPVSNIPQSTNHFLVIIGEKDNVVPLSKSLELTDLVRSRGGRIEKNPQFAHPFKDVEREIHQKRLRIIDDFLKSK